MPCLSNSIECAQLQDLVALRKGARVGLEVEGRSLQGRLASFDGDESPTHVHAPNDRRRCSGNLDDVGDEPGERLVPGHRVRWMELRPVAPCPVFEEEETTLPEAWEQCLEAGPGRPVVVRGVVDHEVERTLELMCDEALENAPIGLADSPDRVYAVEQSAALDVVAEVRTVLAHDDVDGDVSTWLEHLGPEGRASSVPDAELEDVGRVKLRPSCEERAVLVDEAPVLEEGETFLSELPVLVFVVLESEDEIAKEHTVLTPVELVEHVDR